MMLESHKVNMSTENENPAKPQAIVATKVTKCFGEGEAKVTGRPCSRPFRRSRTISLR